MTGREKEQRMLICHMLADIEDENNLMQILAFVLCRFHSPAKQAGVQERLDAQDEMIGQIYNNLDTLKPEYAMDMPETQETTDTLFGFLERLGAIKRDVYETASEEIQRFLITSLSAREKQGFARGFKMAAALLGGVAWESAQ